MEHYGAYSFTACLEESSLVLSALYLRVPGIHLKRVWPTVQLMSFYGNSQGGKSQGERLDPSKVFHVRDFLPGWATPPELRSGQPDELSLEPHHCWAFCEALESGDLRNASWVLQMVGLRDDLDRIHQVAEAYGQLPLPDPD